MTSILVCFTHKAIMWLQSMWNIVYGRLLRYFGCVIFWSMTGNHLCSSRTAWTS